MSTFSDNSHCILSALHLNADSYEWLNLIYSNLPLLVVNNPISSATFFDDKNAKWQKLLEKITEEPKDAGWEAGFSCAQIVKQDVEVLVHKQLKHVKVELGGDSGPGLRVSVSLENPKLKALINDETLSSEILHLSLLSGLIICVPNDMVCLITSHYTRNCGAPSIVALDSSNRGPLYLSCFTENPFLRDATLNVVFEFNFFRALTRSARLVSRDCGLTRSEKRSRKEEGNFNKNVVSLKHFRESVIAEIRQPILANFERREDASSCEVRLSSHLSLVVENCHLIDTFTVVICPRPKYSLGKHSYYSVGAGSFSLRYGSEHVQPTVGEWLHQDANKPNENSKLCMSVIGMCANSDVSAVIVSKLSSWGDSCKPGINGYMLHLLGQDLYKKILKHCRQLSKVSANMHTIEKYTDILAHKYQLLGGKKNSSLVQLRIKKALLYIYAFKDEDSSCLCLDAEKPAVSEDSLLEIAHNVDLIDAEEMAEFFCLNYSAEVEGQVLAALGKDNRSPMSKSFMNFLGTSHLELLQLIQLMLKS